MSKLQNDVHVHGFYPELFSVPAGSYTSNPAYGPGAPLVNTYLPYEIPTGSTSLVVADGTYFFAQTQAVIREKQKSTDCTVSIALDSTEPVPAFGSNELRIRTRSPNLKNPPSFNTTLPLFSFAHLPPLFIEVEIVNQMNVPILPLNTSSGQANLLRARLLVDSTLALIVYNTVTQTITPLLTSDLDPFFGVPNTAITVRVRGDYKSQYLAS